MPIPRFAGEQLSFDNGVLFFGDNLEVLSKHVADESVDLIYLDPPFNSNKSYNLLFEQKDGSKAAGQIKAFDDTWRWSLESARVYDEIVAGGGDTSSMIRGLRAIIGTSDMLAYITMMTPRLAEMHRVLKSTGSLYLHCDSGASHYIKIMLDAIFGPAHFLNEIAWKRTPFAGSSKARARQYPRSHDVLLFYAKDEKWRWNPPTLPYTDEYLARFKWDDGDGRGPYRKTLLKTYSKETLDRLRGDNRLIEPTRAGANFSYKQYLAESSGTRQIDDVWGDVNSINPVAKERRGYPTQKPVALLERIIAASSNPGDVVLDPFCGCGTAIDAAQRLGRKWIGIDITEVAIDVIRDRLLEVFGPIDYAMGGEPPTVEAAEALWRLNPIEFQRWACSKIGITRPPRKGADRGIDGEIVGTFDDGTSWKALVSVKGGKVRPEHLRDLHGTMTREGAYTGIFLSLNPPTRSMKSEVADAGFTETGQARLQVLTVEELLEGKRPDLPARAAAAPVQERWLRAV